MGNNRTLQASNLVVANTLDLASQVPIWIPLLLTQPGDEIPCPWMIYNIYNLRAKGKLNILDFLLGHGWSNTCINEAIQNTYGSSKPYSMTYGSHVEWLRITY